jgi:hypothetical protein
VLDLVVVNDDWVHAKWMLALMSASPQIPTFHYHSVDFTALAELRVNGNAELYLMDISSCGMEKKNSVPCMHITLPVDP